MENLDKILVPIGLAIMITYHVILLYRCLNHPETTAIGYENHCKRVWVERVLQVEGNDRGMYLAVISSTISAATFYGSTSLIMSSIVGTWLGASSHNIFLMSTNVYGDKSFGLILVKYFSILTCFLVSFASFLLCVRLGPCNLPPEHAQQPGPCRVHSESSGQGKRLVGCGLPCHMLCGHSAPLDLWSDSDVRVLSAPRDDLVICRRQLDPAGPVPTSYKE